MHLSCTEAGKTNAQPPGRQAKKAIEQAGDFNLSCLSGHSKISSYQKHRHADFLNQFKALYFVNEAASCIKARFIQIHEHNLRVQLCPFRYVFDNPL